MLVPYEPIKEIITAVTNDVDIASRDSYMRAIKDFMEFVVGRSKVNPMQNPHTSFTAYKAHLQTLYKASTINRSLSVIRKFYEFAAIYGLITYEQYLAVKNIKNVRNSTDPFKQWLTKDQASLLLQTPDNSLSGKRDKAIIVLLLVLGLRRSEALSLTWDQFITQDGKLLITGIQTKGNKIRTLVVPDKYIPYLNEWAQVNTSDYICVQVDQWDNCGGQLSKGGLNYIIGKYNIRPHDLRRTGANIVYTETDNIEMVQQFLGHADTHTTKLYVQPFDMIEKSPTQYIDI